MIGKLVANRYEIISEIGIGGMAKVYKAKCNVLNRNVAIKILKDEYNKDETFIKKFNSEAQAIASLSHPNIVNVYDVGVDNGTNYIVMELLSQQTLKQYIEKRGILSEEECIKIAMQIASALEAAHKLNIIHRDIKPHNIIIDKSGNVKVTDFGIAKFVSNATITDLGNNMGSVHYFSPEQAKGGYIDEKTDIYSLGVVMYEMATNKLPFDGENSVAIAIKHIQEKPQDPILLNPNISLRFNNIILKAMCKNTSGRYRNATEMLEEMSELKKEEFSSNKVEASATQIIPQLPDLEDNNSFNLRTRDPRKMTVISRRKVDVEEEMQEGAKIEKEEKTKVSKKRIIVVSSIIAILLAFCTVIYFAVTLLVDILEPEVKPYTTVTVPNLVGRLYEDVKSEYALQGLDVIVDKYVYNEEYENGVVIFQSLEKGTQTSSGKIYVEVSKGAKMVKVPNVIGKDIRIAQYELVDTLGFVVEIKEVIDEEILAGQIISQDKEKDKEIPYGSTIVLEVSKGDGKELVVMPLVLNKSEADAKKTLEDLKLVVSIKYVNNKDKKNGVVVKQSYPQNQQLKEGDVVELEVNKLLITKAITVNISSLLSGNQVDIYNIKNINVKVEASVDGSPYNSVYNTTVKETTKSVSFNINGYQKATLKIYIDGKLKDTKEVKFK